MTSTDHSSILTAELTAVAGLLARADAMCSMLLGLSGAGLVFTLTAVPGAAPVVERVLLVVAALTWATAALVLLQRAVRPRLGGSGFCRWASLDASEVLAEVTALDADRHNAGELVILSQIARRKFTAIRRAVDLMAIGLAAVAAAILTGAIT